MAGGDGSLAAVAAAALDTDAAFVCVPFGTRNHFARDVGLDRNDPLAALAAFDDGVERRVDVGRVNDRLFLNNISLGVYAGLVHRREHHRRRGEALARARGLLSVAHHRHRLHVRVNGEELVARVLLIGNNRYEVSLFTLGERERLDAGELQLWAAAGVFPTAWEERVDARFTLELAGAHGPGCDRRRARRPRAAARVESLPGRAACAPAGCARIGAMPRSSATNHELARIELLAGLPGETLADLGKRMERQEVAPGTAIVREGDTGDRFYVVFAGHALRLEQRDGQARDAAPRRLLRRGVAHDGHAAHRDGDGDHARRRRELRPRDVRRDPTTAVRGRLSR